MVIIMLVFTFSITFQVRNNGWFNHYVNMVESSSN
jgi:hypothetical protein